MRQNVTRTIRGQAVDSNSEPATSLFDPKCLRCRGRQRLVPLGGISAHPSQISGKEQQLVFVCLVTFISDPQQRIKAIYAAVILDFCIPSKVLLSVFIVMVERGPSFSQVPSLRTIGAIKTLACLRII